MGASQVLRLSLAALCLLGGPVLADECQPSTWARSLLVVGSVNCRFSVKTALIVDSDTCAALAFENDITLADLLKLNPGLACDAILPDTRYCVEGFLEPFRAYDGLCGPDHKNATCVGTEKQCCNKKTWTCGDSEDDCTADCYEGNCY